jgi:hypothetical protein
MNLNTNPQGPTRSEFYGRRVVLNAAGRSHLAVTLKRGKRMEAGTIIGESREKTAWRIRWDGWAVEQGLHKSYVEVLPVDEQRSA